MVTYRACSSKKFSLMCLFSHSVQALTRHTGNGKYSQVVSYALAGYLIGKWPQCCAFHHSKCLYHSALRYTHSGTGILDFKNF